MHLPVIYFFENVIGWKVEYKHINNIPSIVSIKPDLIIMSSIGGADIYVEIAQFIKNSNIPLLTNTTEGFFREKDIEEFVWGWNKDKIIYEEICNYWSYKNYKMALLYYPNRLNTSRMCGSLGHDKYIFLDKKITIKTKYKKIIGYAGFDYNKIFESKERYAEIIPKVEINLKIVKQVLNVIVENNPDILFIIKSHPSDMGKIPLEIKDLIKSPNIIVLPFETSIVEAISNSDIWLSFSSGSTLEAWLQNIPTISFLTDENRFSSDAMYGTVTEDNPNKINEMINEFYIENKITRFEEKKEIRQRLIRDMIGFSDGFNHVRYMSAIKPYIEDKQNIPKNLRTPLKYRLKGYLKYVVYMIARNKYKLPFFGKYAHIYGNWDQKVFLEQKDIYFKALDIFYNVNKEKIMSIYNNYDSDFKEKNLNE
jgi:hypothetical protein